MRFGSAARRFGCSSFMRPTSSFVSPSSFSALRGGAFASSRQFYFTSKPHLRKLVPKKPSFPAPVVQRKFSQSKVSKQAQTLVPTASKEAMYPLIAVGMAGIGGLCAYGWSMKAEENAFPEYVGQRVRATYGYVAGGIVLTGLSCAFLHNAGIAHRLVTMNPILFAGGSIAATIGSMVGLYAMDRDNFMGRTGMFGLFNLCMGASLCPIGFLGGPLIMKAFLATGCIVGSLTAVAACAPHESFLQMGGTLSIGLGVLIAASIGNMFFASAMLTNVVLYGGLGLFGFFVLHDTQKVVHNATHQIEYDPVTSSLSIYLDFINIFVRMVTILSQGGNRRR